MGYLCYMLQHNLKEVKRKIESSLRAKEREIEKANDHFLNSVLVDAKKNLAYNGSVARGDLINSLTRTKEDVGTNLDHAGFVEFGTKGKVKIPVGLQNIARQFKNKKGRFSDFIEDLTEWAKAKGIFKNKGQVFRIARHLLDEGQEAKPFFFPAVFKNKIIWKKRLKKAIKKKR